MSGDGENIRVIIRGKPSDAQLNPASVNQPGSEQVIQFHVPSHQVQIKDEKAPEGKLLFAYDDVLPSTCKQADVFDNCKPLLDAVLQGYNATIFAYGQSGSGKSHTMEGNLEKIIGISSGTPQWENNAGLLPSTIDYIFKYIQNAPQNGPAGKPTTYLVHCVYVEIYNETVFDLLNEEKILQVGEIKEKDSTGMPAGFVLRDATDIPCKNAGEAIDLLKRGGMKRRSSSTSLNARSSRSHAIFMMYVETSQWLDEDTNIIKTGRINMVDLAGSERLSQSKVEGVHKREAANINQSLFSLGRCISALVRQQTQGQSNEHIPFRTSKLTMLLKDSLAGSAKTLMIGCVRVEERYRETSVSTLRFAEKLKQIKNKPIVNEDPRDSMLRKLQEQVEQMKLQLQNQASGAVGIPGIGMGVGGFPGAPGDPLGNSGLSNFIITAGAADPRSFLTKYIALAKAAGASVQPVARPSDASGDSGDSNALPVLARRPPRRRAMSASAVDLSALAMQATEAAAQLEEQANERENPPASEGFSVTVTDAETGQTIKTLTGAATTTNAQATFRRLQTAPQSASAEASDSVDSPDSQSSSLTTAGRPRSLTSATKPLNAEALAQIKKTAAAKAQNRNSMSAIGAPSLSRPSSGGSQSAADEFSSSPPNAPAVPKSPSQAFLDSKFSLNDVFAKAAFHTAVKQSAAVNPLQKPSPGRVGMSELPPGLDFSLPFPEDLDKEEIMKFHFMLRQKGKGRHEQEDDEEVEELPALQKPPRIRKSPGSEETKGEHEEKRADGTENSSTKHEQGAHKESTENPALELTPTGVLSPRAAATAAIAAEEKRISLADVPSLFRSGSAASSGRFAGLSSFGLLKAEVSRLEETLFSLEQDFLRRRSNFALSHWRRHEGEIEIFKSAVQNLKEKVKILSKSKEPEKGKPFILNESLSTSGVPSSHSQVVNSPSFSDVPNTFRQSQVSLYMFLCSCVERLDGQAIQMRIQMEQSKRIAEAHKTQVAIQRIQQSKLASPKKMPASGRSGAGNAAASMSFF